MIVAESSLSILPDALHPLDAAPVDDPWNLTELDDLLSEVEAVDAAVLVGLIPRESGIRVLLTRRTESLRHHAGQVSFPGGRIERADADPIAAAVREAQEEIGLTVESITPLGFLDPLATISGFRVLPVVAWIDPGYVATPDPNEVDEVFEVDLDYLMRPDNLERIPIEYRGRSRQVLQFRDSPQASRHRIWGATASILFNLRERLARFEAQT